MHMRNLKEDDISKYSYGLSPEASGAGQFWFLGPSFEHVEFKASDPSGSKA